MDKYKEIIETYENDMIKDLDIEKETHAKIFGTIVNIKKIITKRKEMMAIFDLEDYTHKISVTVFPRQFKEYAHMLIENEAVYVEGNLQIDSFGGEEVIKMTLNSLVDITDIYNEKGFKVYILVEEQEKNKLIELKQLIRYHHGNHRIFIATRENGKRKLVELGENLRVNPTKEFILKVSNLLGKGTIKIKK